MHFIKNILFSLFLLGTVAIYGQPTSIFYVPHQDDEVLSLSVGIVNHLHAGHDVHVVLYTDGFPSDVAAGRVNAARTRAGFSTLTKEEMVTARNREFTRATRSLGVPQRNIHIRNVRPINVRSLRRLILEFERRFDRPNHKAMSYRDFATAHNVSGKALRRLHKAGRIAAAPRYYIRLIQMEENLYQRERRGNGNPPVIRGSYETYRPSYLQPIQDAVQSYLPIRRNGRYDFAETFRRGDLAFGFFSVGDNRFLDINSRPRSKVHR